jgi:alkylation response protein AidB-like acyl-CoA dehydrogenase
VTLDEVQVGPDALLGPLHDGWTLMVSAIGYERIGFDCLTRAMAWLAGIEQETGQLPPSRQHVMKGELVRLRFQAANARALAYHAVHTATAGDGHMDEIAAAYSKIACGRVGQAVARLAGLEFANGPAWVHAAVAEAPEFTIAAGVPDIQLGLIAAEFPIGRAVR